MSKTISLLAEAESEGGDIQFIDLPDDALLTIFTHLDIASLAQLSRVCRRLKALLNRDHVWMLFNDNFNILQVDNDKHDKGLSLKEKFRISHNREKGVYEETLLTNFPGRQLPWLQYHNGNLWVSSRNLIQSINPSVHKKSRNKKNNSGHKLNRDVTKFVIRDEKIVSGCLDGSIHIWETSGSHTEICNAHGLDTQAVDLCGSTIVSGSREATLKVYSMQYDDSGGIQGVEERSSFPMGDRVWSVALSQGGCFCASGTAFCEGESPISIVDLNKMCRVSQLGQEHKIGAGVLDLLFEDERSLLTCGYDAYLRQWDLRTNTCVCCWEQQYDSAYYCLRSDGHRSIFAGTSRHGSVDLWDKRQTKSPVKTFYVGHRNSPVYSLDFSSTHLFVALDLQVKALNFSCYK